MSGNIITQSVTHSTRRPAGRAGARSAHRPRARSVTRSSQAGGPAIGPAGTPPSSQRPPRSGRTEPAPGEGSAAGVHSGSVLSAASGPAPSAGPPRRPGPSDGSAVHGPWYSPGRAARELGLKRREFDLAVQLGRVRTVRDEGGGGVRVTRAELDRVRGEEGFPEALVRHIATVGTAEGAALMNVQSARFTRLARLGRITPVSFYLNRYRAVVWLYLVEELLEFSADEANSSLLSGRTPPHLRDQLEAGADLRPRNWRGRHLGFLLRQAPDAWSRAAAMASLLDPDDVAEIVLDPDERAHLARLGPVRPAHDFPDTPVAQVTARITTAQDPDEIGRLRAELWQTVTEARELHPAPAPGPTSVPVIPEPADADGTVRPEPQPDSGEARPRGFLARLRRGRG